MLLVPYSLFSCLFQSCLALWSPRLGEREREREREREGEREMVYNMSRAMRKPFFAICEQQRRRSACASAQSDQRLCYSLSGYYNSSSFYIQNFKCLPSVCGCAGRFESTLVANPEDRFSRDEAHIMLLVHLFIYFVCVTVCLFSLSLGVIGWLRLLITLWTFRLSFCFAEHSLNLPPARVRLLYFGET